MYAGTKTISTFLFLWEVLFFGACPSPRKEEFVAPLSRWIHDSKTAPRFVKYNVDRLWLGGGMFMIVGVLAVWIFLLAVSEQFGVDDCSEPA